VALVGLFLATDTTPAFAATGLVEQFEVTHDIENPTEAVLRAVCSQGIAPTNE
jgi:hypothetical protein